MKPSAGRARLFSPGDRAGPSDVAGVALLVLAVFAPLAALGANTSVLAAGAVLLHLAAALGVIALLGAGAPVALWRAAAPPAVCLLCAVVWGGLGLTNEPRGDWGQTFRQAAQAQAHSLVPDETALELVKLMGLGALGLAATIVGAKAERLRLCVSVVVGAGALYGFVALGLHQNSPLEVFGVSKGSHAGRFTATLLNPNVAGCLFAMLCVIATGLLSAQYNRMRALAPALRVRAWPYLALLLIAVFFFMGACVLTRSRTGLITGAGGVGLVLLLRYGPWRRGSSRLSAKAGWALAAGLSLAVVLSGAGALQRAADLSSAAADRLQAFEHYLELARQAPLTGYGLGAFPVVGLHGLEPAQAAHMWNFRSAHNAPLQVALEGGAPYLLFLGAALSLWAAAGLGPGRAGTRSIRAGLAAAAAVAGVSSLVDIALHVPAIAAFACVALGLAVGAAFDPPQRRNGSNAGPPRRRSRGDPSAA